MSNTESNVVSPVGSYPLISIILVCLNNRHTIECTIQSIIVLDYPKIEFIAIDGGSADGTMDILKKYSDKIDCLISEQDKGVYDAMNKGIRKANGEFIYFIGADDIIINSWRLLTGRLKSQNTVYYCNAYFPVTNKVYDGKFSRVKLMFRNICQQAVFYPRSVFAKYSFTYEYPYLSDYHLNLMLRADHDFRFEYINLLVAVFSEKGMSSTNTDTKFLQDRLKIIKSNYSIFFYIIAYIGLRIHKWHLAYL